MSREARAWFKVKKKKKNKPVSMSRLRYASSENWFSCSDVNAELLYYILWRRNWFHREKIWVPSFSTNVNAQVRICVKRFKIFFIWKLFFVGNLFQNTYFQFYQNELALPINNFLTKTTTWAKQHSIYIMRDSSYLSNIDFFSNVVCSIHCTSFLNHY